MTLRELLQDRKPLPYLLYPLLPVRSRMIIGAPPKSFKSMLAMNMAYSLAEGEPFLKWEVKKPHTVMYVESEIGKWGTAERLGRLLDAKGGMLAADNLHVFPKGRIRYSLDDGAPGLANLRRDIELVKPDVLFIDPLRKFTSKQEDSSTEMVQVFQSLDALQEEFGMAVVLVHHAGKRNEFRSTGDPESLRGSSEIFADGDSYMIIEQPVASRREVLRLNFRFRHAADIAPVMVEFDKDTGIFSVVEKK